MVRRLNSSAVDCARAGHVAIKKLIARTNDFLTATSTQLVYATRLSAFVTAMTR
jgi:hypothetical protein